MQKIFYSVLAVLLLTIPLNAQQIPGARQTKSIIIVNATAHIGNGTIIENSVIGFKNGILTVIGNASSAPLDMANYDIKIDATGQHVYPGFIAPNSTLGLVEIDAVKASDDQVEIGTFNPHIRSVIAYNADSRVIETVRPNGVLLAQIAPRGGTIAGTSSVVHFDAWNWTDAIIKENDGIHLNFPSNFKRTGSWFEPGMIEVNKDYKKQIEEINTFFVAAKAYLSGRANQKNLTFEATRGLFDGTQTLYVNANEERQIVDAIALCKEQIIKKIVIIGGYEADKIADLLKENNVAILLRNVHEMPMSEDDDYDLPYKLAKVLTDKNLLVGLENSGNMERMQSRNFPFLAGTCVGYGLTKEQALQLITLNAAKILGIDKQYGSLELGKSATLFISAGDALDMRTNQLTKAFIDGRELSLTTHQTELNDKYKAKYNQK